MRLQSCLFLLLPACLQAQAYTSYFSGDTADVAPPPLGGIVLMGGATENDNAMRWFLQRANGGDVVVIRASGADGYNDYLYTELGVPVHSVQTIVTPTAAAAADPYVAQQIRNAEALWIAGGDQWRYVSYWKNGPVGDALRYLVGEKKAVIGGTSAGMAILGEAYFSAQFGTVTSADALADPYRNEVALGYQDFLQVPFLDSLITDTHYDDPDRRGRHTAFIARLATVQGRRFRGIACEEYTAVCVAPDGLARVFGGYPQSQDFAYFLQPTCETPFLPETCAPGQPLDWRRNQHALTVYKVPGTNNGNNTFQLGDWKTAQGGDWQRWWVEDGLLKTAFMNNPPDCNTSGGQIPMSPRFRLTPNPAVDQCYLTSDLPVRRVDIFDAYGRLYWQSASVDGNWIQLPQLPPQCYVVQAHIDDRLLTARLLVCH